MNFEKFNTLKEKIEKLPNVKFYSFNEDSIIVENENNEALYQIPFILEEDDTMTLKLKDGEKVKEGKISKEEEFNLYKEDFKKNVKSIFSNYDEGLQNIKKSLKTFPNFELDQEDEKTKEAKKISFDETIEKFASSDFEPIRNINTMFKKQLVEAHQEKQEFIELLNIFDENQELKTHELNYDKLKSMYVEHMIEYEDFNKKLKNINDFHKSIEKIVMNEELANQILSKFDFNEDVKISVPKTLIKVFNSYNEDVGLNIKEVSQQIIDVYNESNFPQDQENPFIYNRSTVSTKDTPQFLQFSTGKYTRQDIETLVHELEQSYYILPDLTHEDLIQIADWRNQCEYMSRTNMISDKKIDEIINGFNNRFSIDTEAQYNDGNSSLGYKDNEERSMGHETGMAYDGTVVPEDDIMDEIDYDDEEDFEEIEGADI